MQDKATKVIRFSELSKKLGGVSRSTVDRWEKAGSFPKRIRLGLNSMGWRENDVDVFIEKLEQGIREEAKNESI